MNISCEKLKVRIEMNTFNYLENNSLCMSEIQELAQHTSLSHEEAELLLKNRTLSGDPCNHTHPAIFITENEVIVETETVFNDSDRTKSPIELAFTSNTEVNHLR